MSGALSDLTKGLLGVDNPDTSPYGASADAARQSQHDYATREGTNYRQENDLANYLRGGIAGTNGPSVAQTQLRAGLDQNNADMLAAGAGSSGVNSVLARYQARQAQGEQAARMQQAAALLRAQEVARYTQQLAGLRVAMGGQSMPLIGANMNQALNYDQLKAQQDQQNAQRDTILGAAGLNGASSGLGSLTSYFGGSSGGGGTNEYGGAAMDYEPAKV